MNFYIASILASIFRTSTKLEFIVNRVPPKLEDTFTFFPFPNRKIDIQENITGQTAKGGLTPSCNESWRCNTTATEYKTNDFLNFVNATCNVGALVV